MGLVGMIYGQRPEGMGDAEWTLECQHRQVAREALKARTPAERGTIFRQWQKTFPGIDKARVVAIWKEGVPMPSDRANTMHKGAA